MLRRRTFVLLATLAALAFPASSLGQSAGDGQYVDPIPGDNGGGSSGSGGSGGSSGGGGDTGSSSGTTPSTPSTPTAAGTTGTTPEASAAATANGELPRTGFDVIVTIELGLAMLLTGVVAQRMLALRERRNQR